MENQIRCPKCGEYFQIDKAGYMEIVAQVRNSEYEKDIAKQKATFEKEKQFSVNQALNELELKTSKQISELQNKLALKEQELNSEKEKIHLEAKSKIDELELKTSKQISELQNKLALKEQELTQETSNSKAAINELKSNYEFMLKEKNEEIVRIQEFKAKQSTKMIGESLEQFCLNEFNKVRATAYPKAYFEKDNAAIKGDDDKASKGDFIFRENDDDGNEIVSIMFEMKNQADETKTKHKNEDFLDKLDKDRKKKNCEYAVLVSLLEEESEYYNTGIVDLCYKYPKMYVIRPQFFLPIIGILREANKNSLSYKKELALIQSQNLDVTNFENDLEDFKSKFIRNYNIAGDHFKKAIEQIDSTIKKLEDIKNHLTQSDKNLRIANDRLEDLTIKKLVKNNPTMKAKFDALNSKSLLS